MPRKRMKPFPLMAFIPVGEVANFRQILQDCGITVLATMIPSSKKSPSLVIEAAKLGRGRCICYWLQVDDFNLDQILEIVFALGGKCKQMTSVEEAVFNPLYREPKKKGRR